jgi:hypothetical protein
MTKKVCKQMLEVFLQKGNDLGDTLYGLKRHHFPPHFAHFFIVAVATACKNLLRLAKNGYFFVSDATT